MVLAMSLSASFLVRPTSFIHGLPKSGPYQSIPRSIQAIVAPRQAKRFTSEKGSMVRGLRG